jgi:starch synthase
MACGVPVAAAHVGGIPEIVEEGQSGSLAATPEAEPLAAALANVLSSSRERAQWSLAARERACSAFGSARYARQYFDLYSALLHRGASVARASH